VFRTDALLRSINDRLGALCASGGCAGPGIDLPPLTTEWVDELMRFAEAEEEEIPEAEEVEEYG
jgi:hypothetical protein